jgi:hypothetical protein
MSPSPMAQARSAPGRPARSAPASRAWVGPLVIGLCFSLGFGVTRRLLELNVTPWIDMGHGFDVQPVPGTSLESLRMRFGAQGESLRANPDPPPKSAVQKPAPSAPVPDPEPSASLRDPQGSGDPKPARGPEEKPPADGAGSPLEAPPAPALPEATPAR